MAILILYLEESIQGMLEDVLTAEGYAVMSTQSATEALRAIEDNDDIDTLLADNFGLNPEAQQAFTDLRQQPALRQRLVVVDISAWDTSYILDWIDDGLIDEHLRLPFDYAQLLGLLRVSGRYPPH